MISPMPVVKLKFSGEKKWFQKFVIVLQGIFMG